MLQKILSQIDIDPTELEIPTEIEQVDNQNVADIIEVIFAVLGVVAFLVIVIAGLRFILSRGDADKAAKARNTVIYAAVGLVLAVSAFTLVRFITEAAG